MGIHIVKMPDIGEGIAEVELVAWHVQEGDLVQEDQVLADVMTDKATVEIPSAVQGKVVALGCGVGQVMAVGAELIRIEVDGAGHTPAPDTPAVALSAAAPGQPSDIAQASGPCEARPVATPMESAATLAQLGQGTTVAKPLASPAVRRRAWDLGVELRYVLGTGPAGRISHQDLDAFVAQGQRSVQGADSRYQKRLQEKAIPIVGLRRQIARRLQEAKRRIPHFTYVEEVDMTELENLRLRLNAEHASTRGKLTLIPFLARAMVLALRDFPHLNARYDDESDVLTQYGAVHLGIATQTDAGLMVPVLQHAEAMDLWACAAELTRLAQAARSGKAQRETLSGSTITLTSLGALGGLVSTPVINRPEVAIVGVNRMVERPVAKGGAVVLRQMMNLSSSFDHRVVDGMHAASFIQQVRGYLECPATMFVD